MGQHSGLVWKSACTFSFLFLIGSATVWGQVRPRVVEAISNEHRVTLEGNVHPLARAEFDRGAALDSQPMTRMLLLLKRSDEQEAALRDFLEQQQEKNSPNYHAWLMPEEIGANYGPAAADVQAVTDWLIGQGFTIEKVYSSKTVVEFSGTAGQVRTAFAAPIRNFEVGGKVYLANASDPQIPAALAPVVAGIVSLNNFPRQSHVRVMGEARKSPGKAGLEPLFTFPLPSGNGNFYGMAPGDFATIYNTAPLLSGTPKNDGSGQSIAIVGETNIHVSDVQAFRQMFGLSANFDTTNVILNGEDPGITSIGEEGEADLDVEWSGAVAPGATVNLVVSASTPASSGVDLSALYIVEHNLAGVMSESYGGCESSLGSGGNAFYNALWEQAAAQGITVMVSSGDNGSAGCDDFNSATSAAQGLAVSGLASTPYNVAVGGTDFDQVNKWSTFWGATNNATTGASALSYIPEIPWNQSCAQIGLSGCGASAPNGSLNIVAGTGGPSSTYSKPNWQLGVTGMPNDNHRDLPDVSLFASPGFDGTGYIYCQSDQTITGAPMCDISNASGGALDFGIVGGTSASAPAFAGIMALVNQYEASHGGTNRQGNANHVLYALVKKAGASCTSSAAEGAGCVFNDVTKGNSVLPTGAAGIGTNSVPCTGGTPNCSVTLASQTGVLVDPANSKTEAWTVAAGYDLTTGLGSVNVNNLAKQWGTVSTVATTTTLTLSPITGITHGTTENVSVNITVTPTSGAATGDVSLIAKFADGTTQGLDQFALASGKVVNGATNSLPGGTYTVTAHYAGDGTNAPSDSTAVSVTVTPENSQTFIVVPSFDANGNLLNGNATSVQYGSNYIIRMYVTDSNALASPTGPPNPTCEMRNVLTCPSGTVTLTDSGNTLGTGGGGAGIYNLNDAGYTRNLSPNLLGGTHTLLAGYSGDGSYHASSSGPVSFTVTPAPSQIQMDSYLSTVLPGQTFQLEANVTSQTAAGTARPGGTVTFYDGDSALPGPVQITSGGPGQIYADIYNISFSSTGPHSISAKYSGDSNYAASTSSPVTVTCLIPTVMTQSETATSITYGQSITVTATLTASSKGPPITGQIFFEDSYPNFTYVTNVSGTDANGNQFLTTTATTVPVSTVTLNAIYQGDGTYASASSPGDLITVFTPDFSLSFPTGGLIVTTGQSGGLAFQVIPATNNASPVSLSCSGNLPFGYGCSVQPTTVNLANGAAGSATVTLTPSVTPTAVTGKAVRPRHSIIGPLPLGKNPLWPVSLMSGLAALLFLGMSRRQKYWQASMGLGLVCVLSVLIGCGGGSSGGGGGGGGGGGVGPFATTTTVLSGTPKVAAGGTVTFTANVTGKGNPTGGVDFYLSGNWYGKGNLVAGTATLTTTIAAPGAYSLTAQYEGDTQNLSSGSGGVSQAVTGSTVINVTGQTGALFHISNVTVTLQ
jgi:hypothetical protein